MSLRDDLIAAKARISQPRKWRRGGSISQGRSCAWNAIYDAIGGGPRVLIAEVALASALPEDRQRATSQSTVIGFNDHPSTTHADIMALFDRAIAAATLPEASK